MVHLFCAGAGVLPGLLRRGGRGGCYLRAGLSRAPGAGSPAAFADRRYVIETGPLLPGVRLVCKLDARMREGGARGGAEVPVWGRSATTDKSHRLRGCKC